MAGGGCKKKKGGEYKTKEDGGRVTQGKGQHAQQERQMLAGVCFCVYVCVWLGAGIMGHGGWWGWWIGLSEP